MTTKIQKWGNSLAVRIPKELATGLHSGVSVSLRREGEVLIVSPSRKHKFNLKDLVANMDANNLHGETDWGKPMGREIW